MTDQAPHTLDEAIAAARAGRRDDAARILRQLVENDPFNADAWVWLGGVTANLAEQRAALEHALTIAPQNQRAQQGLAWLRQNHPEVFTTAPADAGTPRPRSERTTPSYEQRAVVQSNADAETMQAPTYQAQAATATEPVARTYDSPPEAMIVGAPSQTDRMATNPAKPARPLFAPTAQMPIAPPPPATQTTDVVYQRAAGANTARILLLLIWLASFGAIATLAALTFYDSLGFRQAVDGQLARLGFQLDPVYVDNTRIATGAVLAAIAVIDLIIVLGLLYRGRWAWILNLLIALAVTAGTIGLIVLAYVFPPTQTSGFNLLSPALQPLLGLIIFTAVYLVLSFASRRAFFRRRVTETYGR